MRCGVTVSAVIQRIMWSPTPMATDRAFFHFTKGGTARVSHLMTTRALDNLLCPDRDTRLDVSARYLWVQCVNGSMVQWFRRGLDDQVETEDESRQGSSVRR